MAEGTHTGYIWLALYPGADGELDQSFLTFHLGPWLLALHTMAEGSPSLTMPGEVKWEAHWH